MAVMRMNALGATSFVWEQCVSQPVREALNATAEQTIVLTINKRSLSSYGPLTEPPNSIKRHILQI